MKSRNYYEERIIEDIHKELGEGTHVQVEDVRKNNHVLKRGMTIQRKGYNVSPIIYLDSYCEKLEQGANMDSVVKSILKIYRSSLLHNEVDIDFFKDYEKVKDQIVYRLVSRERNRELLEDVPYTEFLDLAICYCCRYSNYEIGEGLILIHNSHMETWGVGPEDLMWQANRNTPQLIPPYLCSMDDALHGVLDQEALNEMRQVQEETGRYMYVLSNEQRCYGAAALLYPGVLRKAAQRLGDRFFILPSSIHETILIKDNNSHTGEELHDMIADINRYQLEPEEVLSDYAYHYDVMSGKIQILGKDCSFCNL